MNDTPGDGPDDGGDEQPNPFKGTPFEAFFSGQGGQGLPDLSALFGGPSARRRPGRRCPT